MKIEIMRVEGLLPVLTALHLPYGKDPSGTLEKDIALIGRLVKAGDEHAKVLRGMIAWIDITAPIYWWREMETYRIGRERLSCESTMHIDCRGLSGDELVKAKAEIPMGREQRAIDMYSYQTLRRIYYQRRGHRLPEWRQFCRAIEDLPMAEDLILIPPFRQTIKEINQ